MKKRITLKDIADECGYSVNTVSRALRNDNKIPAETISKIQAAAKDLGYVQNLAAASLRAESSHIIAIVVEDIVTPHYTELISQITLKLRNHNYHVIIFSPQFEDEYDNSVIQLAISHNIDGMLFFPYMANHDIIKPIIQNNIPLVLVDREIQNISVDVARSDDYSGGYKAGKELARLGHRKILYVAGPLHNGSQPLRQSGFMKALEEENIDLDQVKIIHYKHIINAIRRNTLDTIFLPADYTAIFFFNDQIAYSVMTFLQEKGYKIPQDISLIGFDHLRQTIPYLPPLTSVANKSGVSLADIAIELLLGRIKNYNQPPRIRILPVSLYSEGTTSQAREISFEQT